MSAQSSTPYDVIVIGSGLGALTVASLAAQLRHKRVLVLERHFKAGGFTHSYRRKNHSWDVGLHYVGGMAEGESLRRIFDVITGGQVSWAEMPDPFEVFSYPGLRFEVRKGADAFVADLSERFPHEARAIRRYVRDARRAAMGYSLHMGRRNGSRLFRLGSTAGRLVFPPRWERTTKAYLDSHFNDTALKALLATQWGDYGLPPGSSPFALHAMVATHFMDGGYYPVGGAQQIANSVQGLVEAEGGVFKVDREVTEIICENGRAVGVKARRPRPTEREATEEYRAPVIVSNAGALATYLKLLPPQVPVPFRAQLQDFARRNATTAHISVHIGFGRDPRELGFRGENHWIHGDTDHDAIYAQRMAWLDTGKPLQAYVSFASLKDPRATGHAAEIISVTGYEPFARWREQRWQKRDAQYGELKARIADGLLGLVESHLPGFRAAISYHDVSTPLTTEFFTGHHHGGLYGLPAVSERYAASNLAWTHPVSPIPGLWLTGSDVGSMGIGGAIMSGIAALSYMPQPVNYPHVFRAAAASSKPSAKTADTLTLKAKTKEG